MPELPDITIYLEALERHLLGAELTSVTVRSPFLLRSYDPPIAALEGKRLRTLERLGKRIVFGFDDDLFCVLHLMIAGRLRWKKPGLAPKGRNDLATFAFEPESGSPQTAGTLLLTEASTQKRASLHVVVGRAALAEHDPGGLQVLECTEQEFADRLLRGNHTLKRALTNPRAFSGIGNAYSDEILHRARLSPVKLTQRLTSEEIQSLFVATVEVLQEWIERHRSQLGDRFPDKVTAFHPQMAVHGRYQQPCPVCQTAVQRIRYAANETNYCPGCQTAGKLLKDRALSRLLRDDWPRTVEEWESLHQPPAG